MAGGFPLFRKKRKLIFYGHACGMRVQRVQKVQRVQRGWYRPAGDEIYMPPAAATLPEAAKAKQPRLRRAGNAPLWVLRTTSPGGGKFALLSASELISISRHKGAKTSPSGGGAVGRRGAFQAPDRAVGLFSSGRSPVVWFSLRCCYKLKLSPLPSTHSAPALAGERWWRQPPKGALPTGSIKHSL